MPSPSRRTVLATGPAVGGALLAGGPQARAQTRTRAAEPDSTAADPWTAVLDDADLVWQRMPRTWYEGPFLGNGFLGSGIYAEPGAETRAVRFNVQHSEVQDHRPEFGSLFGLARLPIGWFTLEPANLDFAGIEDAARDWYDTAIDAQRLVGALERLEAMAEWPRRPLDGSRESRAVLKSLTSALIGRFVAAAKDATVDVWGTGPLTRYGAELEVPIATRDEITVLKSIAAHYIMRTADEKGERLAQRELLANLVEALVASEGRDLAPDLRADFDAAADDAARLRVVIDQVASLTDISAPAWAGRLF